MKYRKTLLLLLLFLCFLMELSPDALSHAALKTSDLETVAWNTVAETSMIDENGWLQSMCATDQYIVCLINGSKKTTEPDTLIAFYRNTTDASGNPVEQYSYAFHVTETDYEHGNGMTYNPNTQEIAIAGLFTKRSLQQRRCLYRGCQHLNIQAKSYRGQWKSELFRHRLCTGKRSVCADGKQNCRLLLYFH